MLYGSFVSVISFNRRLNLLLGLWKKMMKSMVEYGNVESSHGILRVERVFARVPQQVQIPGTKRMTKRVTKRMGQAGAKQVVKKVNFFYSRCI
ncbi:hypothetical protein Hanom_Chr05g00432941 [Helianthus anomalus]